MADHDEAQDYKANGPTEIGFRTDGTGIENGVVAFGKQVGVHGISVGGEKGSFFCGVFGESDAGIGVQGQSRNQAGVIGTSDKFDGVQGNGGNLGVGVRGTSTSNDGVVGTSSGERKSGVFGDHTLTQGPAAGVSGRCESPQGAGVFGFSDSGGNGVKGFSSGNDAVVGVANAEFKSGVFGDNSQEHLPASGVSGRSVSPQGAGVFGFSDVSAIGVKGFSAANDGIMGESKAVLKSGVFGLNTELTGAAFGVSGSCDSPDGAGIHGISDQGYGGHFRGGRAPLRLVPASTSGPPTIGNHKRGEFFVDSNGDLFFCKDPGTPGNWFRVPLTPA